MLKRQLAGREWTKRVSASLAWFMLDPDMDPDRSTTKMSSQRCSFRLKDGTRESMAALDLVS